VEREGERLFFVGFHKKQVTGRRPTEHIDYLLLGDKNSPVNLCCPLAAQGCDDLQETARERQSIQWE
jgi:hypothetical protein